MYECRNCCLFKSGFLQQGEEKWMQKGKGWGSEKLGQTQAEGTATSDGESNLHSCLWL